MPAASESEEQELMSMKGILNTILAFVLTYLITKALLYLTGPVVTASLILFGAFILVAGCIGCLAYYAVSLLVLWLRERKR